MDKTKTRKGFSDQTPLSVEYEAPKTLGIHFTTRIRLSWSSNWAGSITGGASRTVLKSSAWTHTTRLSDSCYSRLPHCLSRYSTRHQRLVTRRGGIVIPCSAIQPLGLVDEMPTIQSFEAIERELDNLSHEFLKHIHDSWECHSEWPYRQKLLILFRAW